MNGIKTPTTVDIMIHAMSKEIRDNEISATGTLSPIPAAACYLAQMTTAPQTLPAILDAPDWPFEGELEELFNLMQRGRVGLFFLSGAQIDKSANTNLVSIGSPQRPKVRLPGGAGTAMVYLHAKRVVLFLRHQTVRSLVEKVDFVTGPGTGDIPERTGGPTRLITDLAVFDIKPNQGLTLSSLHPGVDFEEVRAKTGFELDRPKDLKVTEVPSPRILELIHGPVKEKVSLVYPLFASEL